jgi:hypothetical protein
MEISEVLHLFFCLKSAALSFLSSAIRIQEAILLVIEHGACWWLVIDARPGVDSGLLQSSTVGILVLNSGVARVIHVGAIGIPEAKTAKVLGSLTRLRVEIGIGIAVSGLVTLVQMVRRGLVTLIWTKKFGNGSYLSRFQFCPPLGTNWWSGILELARRRWRRSGRLVLRCRKMSLLGASLVGR